MMMMVFLRCRLEDFCNSFGVKTLITNEQDVAAGSCINVEYTPSKLLENKGRA